MNAECLLQYSQKSSRCWGVESTPQCHPLSSTLFCWSVLVLTGIQTLPSHLLFVRITFDHFSVIGNVLYSSPCTLKRCPLSAKCLPNHPHNHHTVLICGFVMSIQHDTSSCSTIFLLLIKVLYIYLTPLISPAWVFSVTVVLSCGFGTTWILGARVLHIGPTYCKHFSGWVWPCQINTTLDMITLDFSGTV